MKILGLFAVVFAIIFVDKMLGFSDMATMVGVVVGSGSYILMNLSHD